MGMWRARRKKNEVEETKEGEMEVPPELPSFNNQVDRRRQRQCHNGPLLLARFRHLSRAEGGCSCVLG